MIASSDLDAGRIVGVFGLRGECKIDATRIGVDALGVGAIVHACLADGSQRRLRIRAARLHKGRPLAAFEGFDDATAAAALVGARLAFERADVVLAPGEFLDADLVGCALVDPSGSELGRVVDVEHFPAQDLLVIGSSRMLVPMVAAFVKSIDIGTKKITVDLPPGLLDAREAETDVAPSTFTNSNEIAPSNDAPRSPSSSLQ